MKGTTVKLNMDVLDIAGCARETDVTISTSAATTAALGATYPSGGVYDVLSTVDCYIKVALDATDVTTTTGYPLLAGNVVTVFVPAGYEIGVIAASGGTLYVHRSRGSY